jgi:CBS domain-containing protein
MRCPSCGHENYAGEDVCDACGADLAGTDTPEDPLTFHGLLLGQHLEQIAVGEPATIGPGGSAMKAVERMRSEGLDCLLVVARGRLVGIFTERDAILKLADERPGSFVLRDVMTKDPVVLRPDDSLAVAIHKMAIGGFRHIPVVDDGRPIGVLAARDVFQHVLTVLG